MLFVLPPLNGDIEPLQSVKWHPGERDLLAVASETNVYLLDIADATHVFGRQAIHQNELHRAGQIFSVPSVSSCITVINHTSLTVVLAHCCL